MLHNKTKCSLTIWFFHLSSKWTDKKCLFATVVSHGPPTLFIMPAMNVIKISGIEHISTAVPGVLKYGGNPESNDLLHIAVA